jgi:hypothetical protein
MSAALPSAAAPDVPAATGMPNDPWVYTIAVPHDATPSLADGTYPGLVAVSDSRVPVGAPPAATNDHLIDSPDGIFLDFYALNSFTTYQTFEALVVIACGPIASMSIDSPSCPVTGVSTGATVDFEVSATSLNGGAPIALYEIDWDYDGVTFNALDSNSDGMFTGAGPFDNPNCPTPTPVDYIVAFRVTDSCTPANTEVFPTTCTVTVDTCASYQEIEWDFAGCGLSYTCGNWQAGGCGLPNTDGANWGSFSWGCSAPGSHSCGMVSPYLTTGGDGLGCGFMGDNYPNADYNVTSPTLTLPAAADSELELDYCFSTSGGGTFFIYINESDCSAAGWTQLAANTTQGCFGNAQYDISTYSGSTVKFRFRFQQSANYGTAGSCSNAGVVMDNVKVSGTFAGTLQEN